MTDYGKSTDGFTKRGTSLEPITADLGTDTTPVDRFFVCSIDDAPKLDTAEWRLAITGDAVAEPATINFDQLTSLPAFEQVAWIECAGNGRQMFTKIAGEQIVEKDKAENTAWMLNGMGIARWKGARLSDVLALAGLTAAAAFVSPMGLDLDNPEGEPVRMCLPLDKALDPTTLVVWEMNGEPLPRTHGAPVRLLVPGWVGAYSVKWLGELTVSTDWVPSWRADEYYVDRTPTGEILGPVTAHPVKSSLALPFPAELTAGRHELFGYARSGHGEIAEVQWSLDGDDWRPARLDPPAGPLAWTVFRIEVDLEAGAHVIRTRATDTTEATQPDSQPFHPLGVLWRSVIPHPIVAT